jgi:hypothetical protein
LPLLSAFYKKSLLLHWSKRCEARAVLLRIERHFGEYS